MIVHQGYLLREFLDRSKKYGINDISRIIGVSRNTVNMMFGYVVFSEEAIDALKASEIEIDGITNDAENVTTLYSNVAEGTVKYGDSPNSNELLKQKLELKEEVIAAQKKTIDILDKHLEQALSKIGKN